MSDEFFEKIAGSEGDKIDRLETILRACIGARKRHEAEWKTNIKFLRGYQWEEEVDTYYGTRTAQKHAPSTLVKMTSNIIYPLARQACALLVDNISQPLAVPATNEPQDVFAAEIGTDLLQFRQGEDREVEKRRLETLWAMTCGLVMRYTHYDADAASLLPGGRVMGAGDIDTFMLNPWQYALSPWAKAPDESEVVCFADVRPVDDINDLYPGHDVKEEAVRPDQWLLERDMSGLVADSHGSGIGGAFIAPKHAALLKKTFIRPGRKHPKGRVYTWANGKLLAGTDIPEGEMPLTAIQWFPTPGSPYPLPFITPLVPIQEHINITLSQLIELKNRQLRGDRLVLGTGTMTEEDEPLSENIDGETGRKTIYADAMIKSVEFMKYDLDPTTAEFLLADLYNAARKVAGIGEATSGET